MAHGSHVPKFGNWENDNDVPYTVYFEKARKGRPGGKMINPNDPEENPNMFSNKASPVQASPPKTRSEPEVPIVRGAVRPAHERRVSREDGDMRQFTGSPAFNGTAASGESAHKRNAGRGPGWGSGSGWGPGSGSGRGRPVRQSAGSEQSIERSPLHPHYQAKAVGKGSDLGLEGKNSFDSIHGTPGRSKMKPGSRPDETPDRGAAVPKFGDWDEKNPSSADGYTHIFNKVREERHNEAGMSPAVGNERFYAPAQKRSTDDDMKGCCFPWGRK